ncbi:hypothetical protein [Kitasatospora sp. NPDC097643]|uniref:SCO2583/SCO2584 N-terminal domain-containing protein n=1 Tax=Kitasatospora sp. NPDC097643 TaxID=3157230 RepID=UPI0033178598
MPIAEDPEPRPAEGREPGGSDPSGAGGKDPFADLVLDEEFVRGATIKEQTGRTRMLAARWKVTPPVDPGGRRSVNDGPQPKRGRLARLGRKPKPRPVDPWGNPRPRRRVEWRAPLFVAITIAVLLAALNLEGLRSWYQDQYGEGSSAAPGPVTASSDEQRPTVDHPWAGSPAENWASGVAGIELPTDVQATGVFSAEEVAAQLQVVKDYVAAANLDPRTVSGGRPDAALALLDAKARAVVESTVTNPSERADATAWFTRFDPLEAIPVSDIVKVQGKMTYEGDGANGVLVHTDVTYVYALRPGPEAAKRAASPKPAAPQSSAPDTAAPRPVALTAADVPGDTWTTRTIVRRAEAFRFYDPKRFHVDPHKTVIADARNQFGNSACGTNDGYLHPQFDQFVPVRPDPTGPARDPYGRDPLPPNSPQGSCGTISRS